MGSVLLTVVLASGCIVEADSQPAHRSWPKPVAARSVSQFDGVYRNRSLDYSTGTPAKNGIELFEILTSRAEPRGTQLEIRSSRPGDVVYLRLLEDTRRQIASVVLRRGVDYTLSSGSINLRGKSLGWQGGPGNIGASLRHSSFHLSLTSTGGLLGRYTEGGVALAAYTIPMATGMDQWMFWPKLSPQ